MKAIEANIGNSLKGRLSKQPLASLFIAFRLEPMVEGEHSVCYHTEAVINPLSTRLNPRSKVCRDSGERAVAPRMQN